MGAATSGLCDVVTACAGAGGRVRWVVSGCGFCGATGGERSLAGGAGELAGGARLPVGGARSLAGEARSLAGGATPASCRTGSVRIATSAQP